MRYSITLRRNAVIVRNLSSRVLGRVVSAPDQRSQRQDCILLVGADGGTLAAEDLVRFAAVLAEADAAHRVPGSPTVPTLIGLEKLSEIRDGSVVAVDPTGAVITLFRPESKHNSIFATGRCSSNCIMCSQPPVEDERPNVVAQHLRLLELISDSPDELCISGGEPTLLGDDLVVLLRAINDKFPATSVQMLTNGRRYSDIAYVEKLAAAAPKAGFISAIPLYADVAAVHDYVVQVKGAFDETLLGLYNTARTGLATEVRVVLHKVTIPRLTALAEFIYRNIPFVGHVALMGLENMGYVKKNCDLLWADPLDYAAELEEAIRILFERGMPVSIYNLPYCVLPKSLWPFARQSISDFKNIFLEACDSCAARELCAGLFSSSETRHSRGINPLAVRPTQADLCICRPSSIENL
jgi:His-Xaa-Ser system radical SAM maturase HxsC